MHQKMTVEELLLDESFIDFCQHLHSTHKAKWESWALADPGNAKMLEEARELLSVLSPELPESEVAAEVEKFRQQFGNSYSNIDTGKRRNNLRRIYISVAAAACIALVTFFLWPASGEETLPLTVVEHQAGFGERKQLQLPDGSTVILNSNSRLTYTSEYNKKERRIELSGDAYFEVAKDPAKKFIVYSNSFSTTALGTAFYVHGREPNQSYTVNLIEGKVSLKNLSGQPFLLNAGETATWTRKGFDRNGFDTASLRQWIDGRLSFQRVALSDVLQHLSKWYAVEIEDQRQKTGTISITGDYSSKPLEDILKAICFSLSCKYTITGNKIIIQ